MVACLKAVSAHVPAGQQVFFRSFFALVPIAVMIAVRGGFARLLVTSSLVGHFWRGAVGTLAMISWFFAIARLDLPAAMALNFVSPLMVVLLAAVFLGEKLKPLRCLAVVLGFIGILFILLPQIELVGGIGLERSKIIGAAAALASAFFGAMAMILVRHLIKRELTTTIVVYFSLTSSLIALATVPFGWVLPDLWETSLLVLSGLFGGIGQLLLTQSYRYADASTIAPFDYTQMVFVLAVAYFLFGETPTVNVLAGATIVIAGGLMIILAEHRPRSSRRDID